MTTAISDIERLTQLAVALQERHTLEELLQLLADGAAACVGAPRVSVRLFDPGRSKLLAAARAGEPMHADPTFTFRRGEGLVGWIAEHAEPIRSADAEADARFLKRDDQKEEIGSYLGVPLMAGRACIGVLSAAHPRKDHFTAHHQSLLTLVAGIFSPHIELQRASRVSRIDAVTGVLGREALASVFPDVTRPLCVAVADVDRLGDINAEHGPAIGDEVMRAVAGLLAGTLRSGDAVVRWEKDKFVVLLPDVMLMRAFRIAERVLHAVEAHPIVVGSLSLSVTLSIGIAERRPSEPQDSVLGRADDALAAAKERGRNRVEVAL